MIEAAAGQSWPGLPEAAGDAGGGRRGRNGIRGGVWWQGCCGDHGEFY